MDRISELEKKRKKRIEAEREERESLRPVLTDMSKIQDLYEIFKTTSKDLVNFPQEGTMRYKQRFIWIALVLYSPSFILGDSLPQGMRKSIAKTLKICSESQISDNCPIVVFNYRHYTDFRSDVDYIYNKLEDYLPDLIFNEVMKVKK